METEELSILRFPKAGIDCIGLKNDLTAVNMLPTLVRLSKAPPVPNFFKDGLKLDHFLLRGRVISLYRSIIRCTKGMDKRDAKELIAFARGDFERYRNERDLDTIKGLISSGKYQMHTLQSSITLAHTARR